VADVKITSPDKVLFPRDGYTKTDVIGYYRSVADVMLPLLRDHPIAMLRFNQGLDGERFYHKHAPKHFPDFIDRATIPTSKGDQIYSVINNIDALTYIANHNAIELHLLGSRADDLSHPDRMVFDFDPSIEDFSLVKDAARWCRDLLKKHKMKSFVMVSGSRGLHVWVPLDRSSTGDEVLAFSGRVAELLVEEHPDALTTEFAKADRGDRIYVDIARNAPAQHAVAPYSLRAKDGAPVATPIGWDELDDKDLTPQRYTLSDVPDLVAKRKDPWNSISKGQRLAAL
jgi:bifunctional non-homologous end joining protein LigD